MKIVSDSVTMVGTALGLVAALAWNEAIKKLIDEFLPKGQGVLSLFIYAGAVTTIAVIATSRLARITERFDNDDH